MIFFQRISLILSVIAIALIVDVAVSVEAPAERAPQQQSQSTSPAAPQKSGARFDVLVRDDFFAGMFHGDKARFNRALRFTEDALARDPKNGDAWVWLGSAHVQLSTEAYAAGDDARGKQLWDQGLAEMDKGVALDPDSIGVHIGRGAPLLGFVSSGGTDNPEAQALLTKAVADCEFALENQAPYFNTIGRHSRGELLFGLASGWSMLGNEAKAHMYLERITKDLPHSPWQAEAQADLAKKPLGEISHTCIGCHVD